MNLCEVLREDHVKPLLVRRALAGLPATGDPTLLVDLEVFLSLHSGTWDAAVVETGTVDGEPEVAVATREVAASASGRRDGVVDERRERAFQTILGRVMNDLMPPGTLGLHRYRRRQAMVGGRRMWVRGLPALHLMRQQYQELSGQEGRYWASAGCARRWLDGGGGWWHGMTLWQLVVPPGSGQEGQASPRMARRPQSRVWGMHEEAQAGDGGASLC